MATARRKPTPPAKKPNRAGERSEVHGVRVKAPPRKRALIDRSAGAEGAPRPRVTPAPAAARKAARRATEEQARVPRSTKRSALPTSSPALPIAKGSPRGAGARRAGADEPVKPHRRRAGDGPRVASAAPAHAGRPGQVAPSADLGAVAKGTGRATASAHLEGEPEGSGRVMELHWGDDIPSSRRSEGIVQRWVKRGDALLRHLAEHGAARHEYRANLKEGRFVWVDTDGRVSAEAQAQVLCSWSSSTSALAMAWADPLVRGAGIARVDGMAAERDDIDEEAAWRVAMEAADRARAEYLYRVTTPHAWYFLALSGLTFPPEADLASRPERTSFSPGTPVAIVLRGLAETRGAVESRAEPAEVVRNRIQGLGQALLLEAEYAYRGTAWVARLQRTGRRLVQLADQLPCSSFESVAAGDPGEWLDRAETIDLSDAIALLEDEWALSH